ncbi:MAG: response regulator [Gemmatimonadaceae bacterium]
MRKRPIPRTILVVDDTPSVRMVIARVCASNGYRVAEATDGDDALRSARALSGAIDLVVTDVDMPGLSGLELATELRLMLPRLPVCFVSGRELPAGALADAEKAGSTAFLMKPFDLAELLLVIRSLLRNQGVREGSPRLYCADERIGRAHPLAAARKSRRAASGVSRVAGRDRVASTESNTPFQAPLLTAIASQSGRSSLCGPWALQPTHSDIR